MSEKSTCFWNKDIGELFRGSLEELFRGPRFSPKGNLVQESTLAVLENSLIAADMDAQVARSILATIREQYLGKVVSLLDLQNMIYRKIMDIISPYACALEIDYSLKPQVIVVCGANGSGKTTTLAKMAYMLSGAKWHVTIAACDTSRNAAVVQLDILSKSSSVEIVTPLSAKDEPATIAYRGYEAALKNDSDILLIDTAGHLDNSTELEEDFGKMFKVLKKLCPAAPHNVILVIDANTGQNAKKQLAAFRKCANVTGMVITKLDGSAKGGTLISLVNNFKIPVHGMTAAEKLSDLANFSADLLSRSIVGL